MQKTYCSNNIYDRCFCSIVFKLQAGVVWQKCPNLVKIDCRAKILVPFQMEVAHSNFPKISRMTVQQLHKWKYWSANLPLQVLGWIILYQLLFMHNYCDTIDTEWSRICTKAPAMCQSRCSTFYWITELCKLNGHLPWQNIEPWQIEPGSKGL